jgi:anti-anti-sigma regulatory factor
MKSMMENTHPTPTTYSLATRDSAIVLTVRGDIDTPDPGELRANLMIAEVIPRRHLIADLSDAAHVPPRALSVLESLGARLAVEGRRLVVVLNRASAASARRTMFAYPIAATVADACRILGLRTPLDATDAAA